MGKDTKQKSSKSGKVTPLMRQYFKVKSKHPEAILLFRVGDFYETFGEDAVEASKILGIVLTSRNNGGSDIALAGFPHHSLDLYLPKLVKAGHRVAICEQMEKPSKQKKVVRRSVTEVITPGLALDDKLLDHRSNNYLCALQFGSRGQYGIAFLDISTGEFLVAEGDSEHVDKLIQGFQPSEIIFSKSYREAFERQFGDKLYTYPLEEWVFTEDYATEKLLSHFEVPSMKGYGVEELHLATIAAGSIIHYLSSTENTGVSHINSIRRIQTDEYVWLDKFTIRNLELVQSQFDTGKSLLEVLDRTISPMGARLLKKWLLLPLKRKPDIEKRLDMVAFFQENWTLAEEISDEIRKIGDLERLISKVPSRKVNPREVQQIKIALEAVDPIKYKLANSQLEALEALAERLNPCTKLIERIETSLIEDPPVNLHKGGVMADGADEELDDLRNVVKNSKDLLLDIQKTEAEKTGISNLKIGFNNVFGYYLEVTNKYKNQGMVPENWVRKQTLTNSERYITDELKKLEEKILGAEEKILELEERLFEELIVNLAEYIQPIQFNAQGIAQLDCLLSFARLASDQRYVRPLIKDDKVLQITAGRHPVIEQQLPLDEQYVPNDVYLDDASQQILMITGPNMSGKSALLRQTALICIMAQMGCYVPAEKAEIGLVDKVFTRVGASDNISSGESTFMVEMNETASIMNNFSDRSLILLDEIGRGTSTYDGISIAWSIAEYLHNNGVARPKTLFATHYHELNELAKKYDRICNFHVSTKEVGNKVIFLRKLVEGGSRHSFGIHVAKMAGMPRSIIERSGLILKELEKKHIGEGDEEGIEPALGKMDADENYQLNIFETVDPLAGKLKEVLQDLDLNSMTPIDCMLKLNEMKKWMEEEEL